MTSEPEKIVWRDQMAIDHGLIDADHRHLIDIINRFVGLSADGLTTDEALEVLYSLQFYAETHFDREETLQNAIDFPFAEAHHKDHLELAKSLHAMIGETRGHADRIEEDLAREMSALLRRWLVDHILGSDLKMREFVTEMGEAAAAMPDLAAIRPPES